MKKLFVLLGILCALCFVSCGNIQLTGGDIGVVSLAIGDELAGQIRSAAASRNVVDGTYTLTARIRGGYSDSQTVAVADDTYSGVTFTFEGVPVGETIVLDLTAKANGNYIWYGNSGKHTVERGENLLTIALGRVSGVLMWSVDGTIITPYGNYGASPTEMNTTNPVYCFDNKGDLYVLEESGDVMPYSLKADGTYTSSVGTGWSTGDIPSFLSYDNASGVLYGMRDTGVIVYLNAKNSSWEVKGELNSDGSSYFGFAVNNNIAYIVEQSGEWGDNGIPLITVKSYDLTLDGEDIKGSEKIGNKINLPASFGSSPTGQMIYQEGALYLLLSRVSIDTMYDASVPTESYSLGAVLKINPNTLALDTSFGSQGYLGLADSEISISGIDNIIKDEPGVNVTDGTVKYHGPKSENEASFYGPQGFVAIMPKKLVIADAGFSMSKGSTLDGSDLVSLTKKSRIVTVDLETLAFEAVNLENLTGAGKDPYYYPAHSVSFGSSHMYIEEYYVERNSQNEL